MKRVLMLTLTAALLASCEDNGCCAKLAEERQKSARLQQLLTELQDAVINSTEPYMKSSNAR